MLRCFQVHLEKAPDCQTLTSESSDQLQTSNALRYEVLTEILSSLGLSCALSQLPTPSPIHLLATSQVPFLIKGRQFQVGAEHFNVGVVLVSA